MKNNELASEPGGDEALVELLSQMVERIADGSPIQLDETAMPTTDSVPLERLRAGILRLAIQHETNRRYLASLSLSHEAPQAPTAPTAPTALGQMHRDLRQFTSQIQDLFPEDSSTNGPEDEALAGAIQKMINLMQDRQRLDILNRENEQLLNVMFEASPDAILLADTSGRIQFLSSAGQKLFAVASDELKFGLNFFDLVDAADQTEAMTHNTQRLAGQYSGVATYQCRRRDGSPFWAEVNGSVLIDPEGKPKGVFVIVRDITDRKTQESILQDNADKLLTLNKMLAELSVTDQLTGVFNRRKFDLALDHELSMIKRYGGCFSLILFDIDHFKRFNDSHGHGAGDQALAAVAGIVKSSVRSTDAVFRYGGEEFALIFPATTEINAAKSVETLRGLVAGLPLSYGGQDLPGVTASFGIACSQGRPLTPAALIEAADQALYRAKTEGRNRVAIA